MVNILTMSGTPMADGMLLGGDILIQAKRNLLNPIEGSG